MVYKVHAEIRTSEKGKKKSLLSIPLLLAVSFSLLLLSVNALSNANRNLIHISIGK